MACPFYARSLVLIPSPQLISNPRSNQCALITSAHSPCRMEIEGDWPHWRVCPRNPEVSEPAGGAPSPR